jgi:hypothetical protein
MPLEHIGVGLEHPQNGLATEFSSVIRAKVPVGIVLPFDRRPPRKPSFRLRMETYAARWTCARALADEGIDFAEVTQSGGW